MSPLLSAPASSVPSDESECPAWHWHLKWYRCFTTLPKSYKARLCALRIEESLHQTPHSMLLMGYVVFSRGMEAKSSLGTTWKVFSETNSMCLRAGDILSSLRLNQGLFLLQERNILQGHIIRLLH